MKTNKSANNPSDIEKTNTTIQNLIIGNVEQGIVIDKWQDACYQFSINDQDILIKQTFSKPADKAEQLKVLFNLDKPERFSIEVMIPLNASNACVLLNNQVLISPIDTQWPEDIIPLNLSACQQKGNSVSTLRTGEFQKINFRWDNGDILEIFAIY